ncbi:hypothetical protein MNBD_GAMMA08-753 [hydrothermal vent metagenome]|uniref:Uncharacterized protein n=1 Tax=hydrothermal vent metagenome TaxID=652676 RepID=A0A3B0WRU3_9ZZZZ
MSDDGIQLSPELMADLRDVLKKQDARTTDDVMAMQYMVAAAGMMLSSIDNAQMNKQDVLNELSGFMTHVFEYMESQKPQFTPPAQDAFGVWKPK